MKRTYLSHDAFRAEDIRFALGVDRSGKSSVQLTHGPNCAEVAMLSPPAITMWPRVTGDGNFGTMWGPTDVTKAKYTLDLGDQDINGEANVHFETFMATLTAIDDKLLDFVFSNQLKLLGRKNLSRDEVKMLQIRSICPKYDKNTGNHTGNTLNLSTSKYAWDGIGGKYARKIAVCDCNGLVLPNGVVEPGDVIAVTMYANQVYTGVGGDKFGIHWGFEDVCVVCQRAKLEVKTHVPVFSGHHFAFAAPYADFSDPVLDELQAAA